VNTKEKGSSGGDGRSEQISGIISPNESNANLISFRNDGGLSSAAYRNVFPPIDVFLGTGRMSAEPEFGH